LDSDHKCPRSSRVPPTVFKKGKIANQHQKSQKNFNRTRKKNLGKERLSENRTQAVKATGTQTETSMKHACLPKKGSSTDRVKGQRKIPLCCRTACEFLTLQEGKPKALGPSDAKKKKKSPKQQNEERKKMQKLLEKNSKKLRQLTEEKTLS